MTRSPYFIVAPAWTIKSSGVRVLHLLCDALNRCGEKAWICPQGAVGGNPLINAPVLTNEIAAFYKDALIEPMVVYPDTVREHPLGYGRVVRYLLAPAGAYGGSRMEEFGASDKVYSYRSDIPNRDGVLCLPTFDKSVFYPPESIQAQKLNSFIRVDKNNNVLDENGNKFIAPRYGSCYYAHKYDKIHGNKLLDVTARSVRLEGSWEKIAEILRGATMCYIYEMTEMIVLARMCGCPVEFVCTPYFSGTPAGWDFEPLDLEGWDERFKRQLAKFVGETQK